jgi:hypothetical protein
MYPGFTAFILLKNELFTEVIKIPVDTFHSATVEDANVETSAAI